MLRGGGALALKSTLAAGAKDDSVSCANSQAFIDQVNAGYETVHRKFEEQFWGTKMALSKGTKLADGTAPEDYSVSALTETKKAMEAFLADEQKLAEARKWLEDPSGTEDQKKVRF